VSNVVANSDGPELALRAVRVPGGGVHAADHLGDLLARLASAVHFS
jgi:hypothetical protein